MKNVAILGSTGSIGRNTLKVVDSLPNEFGVFAISAHTNIQLLAEQVKKYRPKIVAVTDETYYSQCKKAIGAIGEFNGELLCGKDSLVEIAKCQEIDIVLTAIVGAAGLEATLAAAEHGKTLAIANKEPLVIAGKLLTETAKKNGAKILPIDSEHSAIFQAMRAAEKNEVEKIILTASGGPFRGFTIEQLNQVTLEQALNHPTWEMGKKITIDSATMMNKALEIIEAKWLFDVPAENIEVLVHPQSIIHSMVEFVDGSIIAQLGSTDMKLPIQYALTYPHRLKGAAKKLSFDDLAELSFQKPDLEVFKLLKMGFEVAKTNDTTATVFNAAGEQAVAKFLDGEIGFTNIADLVEECLCKHEPTDCLEIEELLEADRWAREQIECFTKAAT